MLVVDDNRTNRTILFEMLSNWGLKPTLCETAGAALMELKQSLDRGSLFPLVISDVDMPGQDGLTLVRRIREQAALSSTLIILLTSADRSGDFFQFRELGISHYLVKPVKQSELFDAIVDLLGIQAVDEPAGSSTSPVDAIGPLNILLAEDSLTNQKLARGLLEKWGHSVTIANNGQEAVDAVQAGAFDVVLMDVQMPEMDGLQATKAIRQLEQQTDSHLPIIAMTAHAMANDREQCLAAGMDAYVPKPIRRDELLQALRSLVPGHHQAAASSD